MDMDFFFERSEIFQYLMLWKNPDIYFSQAGYTRNYSNLSNKKTIQIYTE